MYLQDDRDLRAERTRKKMEKAFGFMIRVRIPGGVLTPAQWLALDQVARDYGNGTHAADHAADRAAARRHQVEPEGDHAGDRRGAAQHHRRLRRRQPQRDVQSPTRAVARARRGASNWRARSPTICCRARRPIARSGSTARRSPAARRRWSSRSTARPTCRANSRSWWRCRRRTTSTFSRTTSASSPSSTTSGDIAGWNVTAGGGMGMTHGEPDTYPRTADVLGFCDTRRRARGRRGGRHRAARLGRPRQPQARAAEIHHRGSRARRLPRRSREARRQSSSAPAQPFIFTSTGDRYGWTRGRGRPRPSHAVRARTAACATSGPARSSCPALREIAQIHDGDFRITPNQNLIVANVPTEQRRPRSSASRATPACWRRWSGLRRNSMACVALPTCGLALAESERYLPDLLDALDERLAGARAVRRRHRHPHDRLPERLRAALSRRDRFGRQRARPLQSLSRRGLRRLAHVQALRRGSRPRRHRCRARPAVCRLRGASAQKGERFGDFAIRAGFVAATGNGRDFHANTGAKRVVTA